MTTNVLENDVLNSYVEKETVINFLKNKYNASKYYKVEVKSLWGSCYRLNFWAEEKGRLDAAFCSYKIVKSLFIRLGITDNGWNVVEEHED